MRGYLTGTPTEIDYDPFKALAVTQRLGFERVLTTGSRSSPGIGDYTLFSGARFSVIIFPAFGKGFRLHAMPSARSPRQVSGFTEVTSPGLNAAIFYVLKEQRTLRSCIRS